MAAIVEVIEKLGVDAFIPGDSVSAPLCSHGPTLLFQRYIKGKSPRRYFACSASRDRKACQFFQWEDEKLTAGKEIMQREFLQKLKEEKLAVEGFRKLRDATIKSKHKLKFCSQCSCIIFDYDKVHNDHQLRKITREDLHEPSKFLSPAENKKTNAQYFFSESSTVLMVNLLKKLGYESIICLGVPRIHEKLAKMNKSGSKKSDCILLDLDKRYAQFLQPAEFLHYNMFNNFFYGGEEDEKRFKDFLAGAEKGKIALVMDPPFGGLMSILSASIRKLLNMFDDDSPFDVKDIAIVMVFPYFLESHVSESFPSLRMMDYKVNYENHPHFKQRSSGRGSPIRIYTNILGKDFVLPENEGYRFCSICERYVAKENKHCQQCNVCSSKDGRTYIHCEKCGKCVKPDRIHCSTCKSCEQKDHDCEKKCRNLVTCHICGDVGHKRRDCQQKAVVKNLKRRSADPGETAAKKKLKPEKRRKGRKKKIK